MKWRGRRESENIVESPSFKIKRAYDKVKKMNAYWTSGQYRTETQQMMTSLRLLLIPLKYRTVVRLEVHQTKESFQKFLVIINLRNSSI